jgi:hypothetical protein
MNSPKPGSTASWDWEIHLQKRITTEVEARKDWREERAARYFGQPDLKRSRSLSAAWGTPFRAAALKSNLA